jgi:hypothetical protein
VSSPDYIQIARQYGLDLAVYPLDDAFKQVGVSRSYGYELINRGVFKPIRLADRKVVIRATDLAKYLHDHDEQQLPARPRGRRKAVA